MFRNAILYTNISLPYIRRQKPILYLSVPYPSMKYTRRKNKDWQYVDLLLAYTVRG